MTYSPSRRDKAAVALANAALRLASRDYRRLLRRSLQAAVTAVADGDLGVRDTFVSARIPKDRRVNGEGQQVNITVRGYGGYSRESAAALKSAEEIADQLRWHGRSGS